MKINMKNSGMEMFTLNSKLIIFLFLLFSFNNVWADYESLPGERVAPNNLDSTKIPLFVILSFDDCRHPDGVAWVTDTLLGAQINPSGVDNKATFDGKKIASNFYVIGNSDTALHNSNYESSKAWKRAFDLGNEIGNHSWSHEYNYSELNDSDLYNEISNCNRRIVNITGIPQIQIFGHRTPYLAFNANTYSKLSELGVLYDGSIENGIQGSQQTWAQPLFPGTMENGWYAYTTYVANGFWQVPNGVLCTTPTGNFTNFAYDSDSQIGWPNTNTTDTSFFNNHKYAIDFHYNRNRAPLSLNFHSDYYSTTNDGNNNFTVPLAKRKQALKNIVAYLLSLPDVRIVTGMDIIRWMRNPVELTDLSRNDKLTFKTDNASGIISQGEDTTDSNGSTVSVNNYTCTVSVKDTPNGITDGFAGLYYPIGKAITGAHSVRITYNSNIPLNFTLNQSDLGAYSYQLGLASTGGNDTTVEVPIIADHFMQPRPTDSTFRLPLDVSKVSSASLVATALDTTLPGTFTGSFELFGCGSVAPDNVSNLSIVSIVNNNMNLTWDLPVNTPHKIKVLMDTNSISSVSDSINVIYTTNIDTFSTSWTSVHMESGMHYYVKIFTLNSIGIWSSGVEVNDTIPYPRYVLSVVNGTGDGEYVQGDSIDIVADNPAIGKRFIGWSGDTAYVDSPSIQSTKVYMPTESVTVAAEYEDIEYLLTITNGSGGGSYILGTEVTVTADNPPVNHIFNGWSGDTAYLDSANNSIAIVTMPAESISITAEFLDTTKPCYVLTVNSGLGTGEYVQDDSVTIVANSPETGKEFIGWSGDTSFVVDATMESTTVIMPAESVSVVAEYVDIYYTLTVVNGTGGGDYILGTEVSVSADDAPANHVFNGWSGDVAYIDSVNKKDVTVTMPADSISIQALYLDTSKPTYSLVVNSGSGDGNYNEGDSIEIIADDAEIGKKFLKWTGDTVYINNIYSDTAKIYIPDSNITVTALYEDMKYLLTVSKGAGSGSYVKGSLVTVKANEPQSNNIFNGWTGDITYLNNSSVDSTFITMPDKDISIEANYLDTIADNATLTVINGLGSGTYNSGDSIIISANSPEEGKKFSGWTGAVNNLKNVDSATTKIFIPDTNITVTATFTDILYVLTVKNGTGSGSYKKGSVVNITGAVPDSNMIFDKWVGDTNLIANVDSISTTITMPDSATIVTATYKEIEYIVAGDFNGDSVVNALDFSYVSTYWTNSKQGKTDSLMELAPYVGELPYIAVSPNGVFDFEDLSIFTSSCYWFYENRLATIEDRSDDFINDDNIKVKASITDNGLALILSVDSIDNLVTVGLRIISNENEIVLINAFGGNLLQKDDAHIFKVNHAINSKNVQSVLTRLSETEAAVSGNGNIAELILASNNSEFDLIVDYKLIDKNHKVIASGRKDVVLQNETNKESSIRDIEISIAPNPYLISGFGKAGIYRTSKNPITDGQVIDIKLPINYSLVDLSIYDNTGDLIACNSDPEVVSNEDGSLRYKWYGINSNNRFIASGTYYLVVKYRLPSGKILQTRKAINIKR